MTDSPIRQIAAFRGVPPAELAAVEAGAVALAFLIFGRDRRRGGAGMSGHTPGPWEITPDRETDDFLYVTAGNWTVAWCERHCGLPDRSEANARLIAAAPDLLEACKEFVRRVEAGEIRSKRTYAAMKAVVAKATGEGQQ